MKVPLLQLIKDEQTEHKIAMSEFYTYAEITRQGFAQAVRRADSERDLWVSIEPLILAYRLTKDRRAGSRMLFYNLNIKDKFGMGVNTFEKLLSDRGFCLAPLRTKVVTTRSSLQSWNYPNLLSKLKVNGINQVVVGDITYVHINGQRFFLFCLTDIYSARIVGHYLGRNMRAVDAMEAAKMWISLRKPENLKSCIHHTDGGGQYFSRIYLTMLKGMEAQISRAVTCLENGYAEQRNGLIKHHFLPTITTSGTGVPRKQMKQIIDMYNHERKQESMGWLSPVVFEESVSKMDIKPEIELFDFKKNGFGF